MTDDEIMKRLIPMKRTRRKRTEARLRAQGIETFVQVKDRMELLRRLFPDAREDR